MRKKPTFVLAAACVLAALASTHAQTNFTKVTTGAVVTDGGASGSCAWGDYDNDGYLDLFVTNDAGGGGVNFLYHNNRDGTFTRIDSGPIVHDIGRFRGCTWVDYDNDGNLDLSVVSRTTKNALYQNNGNGMFSRVTNNLIFTDTAQDSIGGSWADYDRDGLVDFFVANVSSTRNSLYHNVSVKSWPGFSYDIEASTNLAAWAFLGRLTVTNLSGSAAIADTNAHGSDHRFYRAVSH